MKKILFILCALLAGVSGAWAENVTYYIPTNRVTTFDSGKKYMLYNTALNGDQDRTGFIYVDGEGSMQKYTSTNRNPKQFRTTSSAYLWKVVTGESNHVSIQNVSNSKYYAYNLGKNDSDPDNLFLYQWGEQTSKQSDANSQNEDDPSTKTANASITFATNKVFIIGNKDAGGYNFWNGNVGDIVMYSDGHPFAFYEVEEVTVPVSVPSGYNGYVGSTKTVNATEWKKNSNWVLTDTWKGNGPGYSSSDMWSPIYLQDVTATGIAFEGWNLRLRLVNSSLTATTNKLQAGGTVTIDVDENSTLDLTMSGENGDPGLHTFNIDGTLIIKTNSDHFTNTKEGSNSVINLGTTGQFTFTADASVTVPRPFAINATLTDPSSPNTVESRTLATFTNVTVSSLSHTISGTDGWTLVANKDALETQTTDGKYYYVEQSTTSGVTLHTYQMTQVAINQQEAIALVTPYYNGSYVGAGLGKYTISLGVTSYANLVDFGTAVMGWETLEDCVVPTIAINQPETGGFYRFHIGDKYMCNSAGGDNVRTVTETNNDKSTIFYLDENNYLIDYAEGYGFNYGYCRATSTGIFNSFDFSASSTKGKYYIHSNPGTGDGTYSNRYITISGSKLAQGQGEWTISEVTTLPVTITAAKYASFCAPVAVTIPSGVTAYRAKSVGGDVITLSSIDDGIIPANTGVILYANVAEATTYNFDITTGGTAGSLLAGTTAAISRPVNSYVLSMDTVGNVGFYKDGANTIPGFKAYYQGAGVKGYSFRFNDETEVKSLNELPLINEGEMYDLSGRQIKKPTRGLYLSKGQKVIVQ